MLNKYPVIPRHSILSTVCFEKQTDLLEGQDLDVTYSCLKAWEAGATEQLPCRLFAFFNSGEHSGASQRHRHLQLLPVEDMINPGSPETDWQPLIDGMTEPLPDHPNLLSNPSLPFCHYAMKIPENPSTSLLESIYRSLYDNAHKSVQSWKQVRQPGHTTTDLDSGEATISYNLAMTTNCMAICPRRHEIAIIQTTSGDGSAAINGTILGGTIMVNEMSEWDALRLGHVAIDEVLAEIGIPYSRDSVHH